MLRTLWEHYRALVRDPATRFPVLTLTVVFIGCWAVFVWIILTLG